MSVMLVQGDARALPLRDASVHICCTSPPYFALRSYGIGVDNGEIGQEPLHDCAGAFTGHACGACWICAMRAVFREVHRVLRNDGTLWINVGDSYASSGTSGYQHLDELGVRMGTGGGKKHSSQLCGRAPTPPGLKPKSLIGLPWRLALALQADGWVLRSEIIWHKLNPMPESVQDRPTRAHEQVFLFSKHGRYYYDGAAVREQAETKWLSRGGSLLNATGWHVQARGVDATRRDDRSNCDESTRACRSVWSLASEPTSASPRTAHRVHVPKDAVSDDTMCTVFPDCPVHGGLAAPVPNVPYDVRVGDLLRRTVRIGIDPAQARLVDSVATDPRLGVVIAAQNSDCAPLSYAPVATDHSTQSHRTVPAPATTPPCTPSAETTAHTGDTPALPLFAAPHHDRPESNRGFGDLDANQTRETPGHIVDTHMAEVSFLPSIPPECMCLFYNVEYRESSHFATFPTELVRRCLRAGAPQQVCRDCGAPWRRTVEKTGDIPRRWSGNDTPTYQDNYRCDNGRSTQATYTTTGFIPTCPCGAPGDGKAVCFDPFCGSGTTVLVARELGHHGLGMDLSWDYLQNIARERLGLTALKEWHEGCDTRYERFDDLPLFAQEVA
jgi:DNA modification methylase